MKKWGNTVKSLPSIVLLVAVILIAELVVRIAQVPGYILPPPSEIAAALIENHALLLMHTWVTLSAVISGLALAIALAVSLSLVMDRWSALKEAIYPLLVVSQAIPIFALAPILLIWFGIGLLPKVLIVALVCFFPLAVNLVEGFGEVDPEAIDLMKTMKADNWMITKSVKLPSAMPYFFSGLKIAATYSVLGAIIGEWLGARAGLGIYMLRATHSYRLSHLFAAVIVVIILSLLMFKMAELAGRLVMPWQQEKKNVMED